MSAETKQGYYELIEPRTLFDSATPVLLGMMYTEYNFQFFRTLPTTEMCIATIILQIFMNVNDGYWDYKREKTVKAGDHKGNPTGKYHPNPKHVLALVWVLFIVSTVCATLIGLQTNIYIWIVGTVCRATTVSYSTGSHTISAGPFGEITVYSTIGFDISLVMVYINVCSKVSFNWNSIYPIILAAGIPEICNFILMLGNDLCNHGTDIVNGRYILVLYTGIKGGLYLFVLNYLLGFFLAGWAVWIGVLPWSVVLILTYIPTIYKNMRFLRKIQAKSKPFPKVVQNTQVLFITGAVGFFIDLVLSLRIR